MTKKELDLLKQKRAEGYNFVARDANGILMFYMKEPIKHTRTWVDAVSKYCIAISGKLTEDLFTAIKFSDSKPKNINDLINKNTGENK